MSHAIITGASQGIGRAIARRLARRGSHVHLISRTASRLDALVEEIRAESGSADAYPVDVADTDGYQAVLEKIASEHQVDQFVANSGGPKPGNLNELGWADWDHANRLLLISVAAGVKAVTRAMAGRGYGRIVVVGSSSTRQPIDGLLLSNAYRAGVLNLIKSVYGDLIRSGITINMASPGRIDTDRVQALDTARATRRGVSLEREQDDSAARIPAGRYGRPDEFAAVAAFLLSPEASYITGQNVLIDGGLISALP